jgi:hypothetical protein
MFLKLRKCKKRLSHFCNSCKPPMEVLDANVEGSKDNFSTNPNVQNKTPPQRQMYLLCAVSTKYPVIRLLLHCMNGFRTRTVALLDADI